MRKKFVFLLSLCFFLIVNKCFSSVVSIPDMTGSPGSIVKIPVEIDNASGICGFQLVISFDQNILEAIQAETGILTENWLIFYNTGITGQISISGLNTNLDELENVSGSLVTISFLVKGDIGQTTNINVSQALFYNSLAEKIPVSLRQGTFTIDVRIGDINGDETIDISDVILCLRMAIKLPVTIGNQSYSEPYPSWLKTRANINTDNEIDISDVILCLRKAIGLN